MLRRAIVLAGGHCPEFLPAEIAPQASDQVVCVDRGLVHCLTLGWVPSLLIGDFDSTPEGLLGRADLQSVRRLGFSPSKDASDLELALDTLASERIDEVVIVGVSGGRTDHMLFNWLLPARRSWPFSLRLMDDSVDATCVTATRALTLSVASGITVSLLALTSCYGIDARGLEYPLAGAQMLAGSTLGLSNVSTGERLEVSVERGTLLVLQVRKQPSDLEAL